MYFSLTLDNRDHQGSISKLTDEQGNTVERFIYDAYGKIVEHTQTESTLNPYCYTGREFDGVGMYDLYYYRARYYDPNIGRFISSDPIEFLAGDFNFFRYVGNSPTNFRDPSGLCPICVWLVEVAVEALIGVSTETLTVAAVAEGAALATAGRAAAGLTVKQLRNKLRKELEEQGKEATSQQINEAMVTAADKLGLTIRGLKAFSTCGNRDKYKTSKKNKFANNGEKGKKRLNFHRDHMPADSVMQARARDIAKSQDKKVCSKAIKAIRGNAETIMLPDFVHIDGRTFGSKVKPLVATDKNNLGKAAEEDIKATRDATARALNNKKIDKACAKAINDSLDKMPTKEEPYLKIINDALALC